MGKLQFKAKVAGGEKETDDKVYNVGVGDKKFDPVNYFIAHRFYESDDPDDLDEIYFEYSVNDGELYYGQYDICEKVTLTKDQIIFEIEDNGVLEVDISDVEITKSFIDYMDKVFGDLFENQL